MVTQSHICSPRLLLASLDVAPCEHQGLHYLLVLSCRIRRELKPGEHWSLQVLYLRCCLQLKTRQGYLMHSRTVCSACSWYVWTLRARAFPLPHHALAHKPSTAGFVLVLLACSGVDGGHAWCGQQAWVFGVENEFPRAWCHTLLETLAPGCLDQKGLKFSLWFGEKPPQVEHSTKVSKCLHSALSNSFSLMFVVVSWTLTLPAFAKDIPMLSLPGPLTHHLL